MSRGGGGGGRGWFYRHKLLRQSSSAREWLDSNSMLFPTQAKAGRPCTHTLLCGGVAVVGDDGSYTTLYEKVANDAATHGGRISICENFPRIYGHWIATGADGRRRYPPDELAARAGVMLGVETDKVPERLLKAQDRARAAALRAVNSKSNRIEWARCIFALDMDYGEIGPDGYSVEEIIKDMQLVQRVMIECGATPLATRVYVCIADQGGTLGVHAYFPYSAYYPEQCMHLATIIVSRLQEERELHMNNDRFWYQIVDTGIYNGSLRLLGVCKTVDCPDCKGKDQKPPAVSAPQVANSTAATGGFSCRTCEDRGFLWKDRRYFPRFYLVENGRLDENEARWMQPLTEFLQPSKANRRSGPKQPQVSERNELMPIVAKPQTEAPFVIRTAQRATDFLWALMVTCSLRLVMSRQPTKFEPPADSPRPNFPRSWIEFFQSVLDAFQPPRRAPPNLPPGDTNEDGSDSEDNDEEGNEELIGILGRRPLRLRPPLPLTEDDKTKDKPGLKLSISNALSDAEEDLDAPAETVSLTPWSSPAGESMSLASTYHGQHPQGRPGRQRSQELKLIDKFKHLLISPQDSLEEARQMGTGVFSEFKNSETVSNDPEGRCRLLQEYLRGWTHRAYARLQVLRLNHSLGYGNTLVHVRGAGQHFCQIAGRHHRRNKIFFFVKRRTGELTQHCFHKFCVGRHFSFGPIGHDDVRVLFSPVEFLAKKKGVTADQRAWAEKLCAVSKALTAKVTRSKVRRKAGIHGEAVAPPTPSSGRSVAPLLSPAYSYNDVALGDDDDEPPPAPGVYMTRAPSPDFVAPDALDQPHQLDGVPQHVPGSPERPPKSKPTAAAAKASGRNDMKTAGATPFPQVSGSTSTPNPRRNKEPERATNAEGDRRPSAQRVTAAPRGRAAQTSADAKSSESKGPKLSEAKGKASEAKGKGSEAKAKGSEAKGGVSSNPSSRSAKTATNSSGGPLPAAGGAGPGAMPAVVNDEILRRMRSRMPERPPISHPPPASIGLRSPLPDTTDPKPPDPKAPDPSPAQSIGASTRDLQVPGASAAIPRAGTKDGDGFVIPAIPLARTSRPSGVPRPSVPPTDAKHAGAKRPLDSAAAAPESPSGSKRPRFAESFSYEELRRPGQLNAYMHVPRRAATDARDRICASTLR